jgi:hypothetical protein
VRGAGAERDAAGVTRCPGKSRVGAGYQKDGPIDERFERLESHPAGVPLSRALEVRPGIVNDDLREAIRAINHVHADGELPSIPLLMRSNLVDADGETADGLFRAETSPEGHIVARSIQIRHEADHRPLLAIHEIGHFLDIHGLPGTGFASADLEVAEVDQWRSAVARSRAVDALTMLTRSREPYLRRRAWRLITPEELWARSYAQFVAIRSGHGDRQRHRGIVQEVEMDHITTVDEIEQEIQIIMRTQHVDYEEAATIVGLRRGELLGDRDILFMRPLSDEQRRRLGLGRSIHEVVAEARAKRNRDSPPSTDRG